MSNAWSVAVRRMLALFHRLLQGRTTDGVKPDKPEFILVGKRAEEKSSRSINPCELGGETGDVTHVELKKRRRMRCVEGRYGKKRLRGDTRIKGRRALFLARVQLPPLSAAPHLLCLHMNPTKRAGIQPTSCVCFCDGPI